MKYVYPELTGDVNSDNLPTTKTRVVEITNDLAATLEKMGSLSEFLTYMPAKYIEQLFEDNENNPTFRFHYFCGDFPCKLPGSNYREDIARYIACGNKEPTLRKAIMRGITTREALQPIAAKELVGHSEKMLDKTETEFFGDIDNAVIACGCSLEDLAADVQRMENKEYDDRNSALEALYRKIWPIYVYLRKMGYSHLDLC